MPDPKTFLLDLPSSSKPSHASIKEEWYPGVKDHWDASTSSRIYDAILGVKAVVIHATAGVSSSGAMSVMKAHKASWHWLVPDEDEVAHGAFAWACAPEARAAWHVRNAARNAAVNGNKNKVNHWSLGIEIVNSQEHNNIDPFSDWQILMTANIVRYCWAKYPNLKQIVSHALLDPDRRSDPGKHFPWGLLKKQILNPADAEVTPKLVEKAVPMELIEIDQNMDSCCA